MLNKICLIGHLGRDPEVRTTNSGGRVVTFSIATTESWRDKATGERRDRTQWHNVTIFNEPLGKVVEQYARKGSKLYIEGAMEYREYEKDGIKRRVAEVVLRQFNGIVELLDRQERRAPSEDDYGRTTTRPSSPAPAPIDDDIPF